MTYPLSGSAPLSTVTFDLSRSSEGLAPELETGTLQGQSLQMRPSGDEVLARGSESRSRSASDAPLPRDGSIQHAPDRPGPFGLSLLTGGVKVPAFGVRYDAAQHAGTEIGPYRVVGEKSRGVEPGFIGKKAWTDSDTAKLSQPGHKFCTKADAWISQRLEPLGGSFQVRKEAAEILSKRGDTGFDPKKHDVGRFLRARPELRSEVFTALKASPRIGAAIKDMIMTTEPKFTKNHYVKLDYRETEGSGERENRKYTLPKSNAKSFGFGAIGKWIHQLMRRQTPEKINRDAMREALANDLMKSFGIFTQKLKLVPTTYQDGTPKLLLDGTHMTGPRGERFSDFEGAIKGKSPNGQLVKLDPETRKPAKNERGNYEVDTSIENLGRNKIFMLVLGDRDAIGSSGGNKGRVGNMFAAIDPGHSLELGGQRLMEKRDIHSDMSFDQPSILGGKCYKNFTIFDQSSFSERMEGVRELQRQMRMNDGNGDDLQVFEAYAKQFSGGGMNYKEQVAAMRDAYVARRDYIVRDVFAERLGVYEYDMAAVGDPAAQETAKAQTLDVLDMLEKITSEHSWMSGDIELAYPTVQKRTEWHVAEAGGSITFSAQGASKDARQQLADFVRRTGIEGDFAITDDGRGNLSVTVPKTEIGKAYGAFSVENLKKVDVERAQILSDALENIGF